MKPTSPTVSVVITSYNHACFLDEAIRSVQGQTRPVDEIIVVDDGSTDDPAMAVGRHPGVRLIRQANQGLAAARNTGLRAATGRYVAFLDADDRLLPTMVDSNLRQFADRPDCAFVYGAYRWVDEARGRVSEPALRLPGEDAYAAFLSGNLVGMHGTVLYRRDIVMAEGGFDNSLRAVEDYELYLRLARKHPVAATPTRLAEYRWHGGNMSDDVRTMLVTTVGIHERHRQTASSRPDWWAAYQQGEQAWRDYYAGVQVGQIARALRNRSGILAAVGRTARVFPFAPRSFLRAVLRNLRQRGEKWFAPAPGAVHFGDLRRTTPISGVFGYDRGKPVDRRYVDAFLASHARDVRGRVLEVGDSAYTRRFGGDRVERADVLNRFPGHPETTFVGDLADGAGLPLNAFDCIVLTQTLHLLFDLPAAVRTLGRGLKPGGVLLVTVPWVSPIDRREWGEAWCWSIAPRALERLLREGFPGGEVAVTAYGNVLAATAFLYGLAEHELGAAELDVHDPYCPVLVAGRALKAQATQ